MADGALLIDEQGNIVLVNPTARRLFRWECRNIEGQKLLNQLPDSLVKELETPITSLLNNFGDSDDLRCNLDEPPRTLRIVLKSVRDTTGENIKGIAVTVQDLTREVQLNAAQKRFISNVSHELRTPLFNIKSYVETLYDLGEQLTKDEQKEFLGVANSETDRLTRLVNDVLDLSKLESGRTIQLEALSIKEAMEQTLRNYKLNAEEKNVKLILNVENNLTFVLGNWDMLLQVFDNLVGNALKFSQKGGTINLKAYTWPDICVASPVDLDNKAPHCEILSPMPKIRVEVSDTGYGISEIDQQRIFERFYRVEDSVHTEVGTGLGLSIVKGIVDKHGSEIRMASEPNTGTTFWFELPLEDSDADQLLLKSARKNWEIENDNSLVK